MFKSAKKLTIALFVLTGITFVLSFSLAGGIDVGTEYGVATGLASADPRIILARIVQIFLGFLGIVAVGFIIYGGFLWMTSAGDESRVDKAKQVLKNAVIGLLIVLSAFAVTTFVLNKLLAATGGAGGGSAGGGEGGGGSGVGALGACVVESVYPEPDQKEVPRNTSIMVTFREKMDSASICNDVDGDRQCEGENILTNGQVKIYKASDDETNYLTDVKVYSRDDKTFIFVPDVFLGSPSEYVWYTVYFSNDILKADGERAFDTCRNDFLEWQFEVSNRLDLTPPQVREKGVFPFPDNGQDEIIIGNEPVRATGAIVVNGLPRVYSPASASGAVREGGGSPAATALIDEHCREEGTLVIEVLIDGITAVLKNKANLSLGKAVFSGNKVVFDGYLTLNSQNSPSAGNSWEVDVIAEKEADTVTINRDVYVFAANPVSPSQIKVGTDALTTVINVVSVINNHPDISARGSGNRINIEAAIAGEGGNNIVLDSSRKDILKIVLMSGGKDRETTVKINGKKDQPMNSVIQINFNEAIFPITISGSAGEVSDYIRIVDITDPGNYLPGKFVISNGYKTVEFLSDNQCGVNGCGEPIYCLPPLSNLKVELTAGRLIACANNADCASKSPYNVCDSVCRDQKGKNYPAADIGLMDGIMDAAFNSLDGNRDSDADGPINFYNENFPDGAKGDNFVWSFFINDQMETDPPIIEKTSAGLGGYGGLIEPLEIDFNKLMMAGSLRTGQIKIANNGEEVIHKALNLWSLGKIGVGYWVSKEDIDVEPLDGQADKTKVFINHNMLREATSYRVQAGSAILDIYQNCFKPSADLGACAGVDENNPSCCDGTPTAVLNADGNCP